MKNPSFIQIARKMDGGCPRLAVRGRLDTTTAPLLESEIQGALAGADRLVLDFSHLERISSAGMRVVLRAHRRAKVARSLMVVEGLRGEVRMAFDISGYSSILNVV